MNKSDLRSGFIQKSCLQRRIQSKKILATARKFLHVVHKNMTCGTNSPRHTSQEASSWNFLDFKQDKPRETVLSHAEKRLLTENN